MDKTTFSEKVLELATYYSKDVESDTVASWYTEFGWLQPWQLDVLIRDIKREQERFPSGKVFYDGIRGHEYKRADLPQRTEAQFVTVVCKCGAGFVVRRSDLLTDGVFFRCPDESCKVGYDGNYIRSHTVNDVCYLYDEKLADAETRTFIEQFKTIIDNFTVNKPKGVTHDGKEGASVRA